jgi:thermitase
VLRRRRLLAIATILLVTVLFSPTPGHAALGPASVGESYVPGQLIVGFNSKLSATTSGLLSSKGLVILREYPEINAALVQVAETAVNSTLISLRANPSVRYAQRNGIVKALFSPNDPYWSQQWGPKKIQANLAWDIQRGSSSVLVAVIDTGVNYNHPDLKANYEAVGYDWVNNDNDPMDDNGHGSHVAGSIAAVLNNGVGVAGVAQVKIMAEKMLGASGSAPVSDAVPAVIHAANSGAEILSNSWGTYFDYQPLHDAFIYAKNHRCLSFAATGNDGGSYRLYPAAYREVIAVGATDQNDKLANFSNWGSWINFTAPGVSIISTWLGTSYNTLSGTSMATPHASAVAALIWSQWPSYDRDQVYLQMRNSVDDLGTQYWDPYYGWGRVNAYKALGGSGSVSGFDFTVSATPGTRTISQGQTTSFTVTVSLASGSAQAVSLSLTGLPSTGAASSFSRLSGNPTYTSTLTISTSTTVATGSYPLTITGTSSGPIQSTSVTLTIQQSAGFDFGVSATPGTRTISRGQSTSFTVSVTLISGTTQSVSLSLTGVPSGAASSFSRLSGNPTYSSTLTISTSTTVATGSYPLTIRGTSSGLTRSTTVTLSIQSGATRTIAYQFTGTLSAGQEGQLRRFNVPSGATEIEVTMYTIGIVDFDLSLWDNSSPQLRTGGRWGSDGPTAQIPNSQYSGISAKPEWITVTLSPASVGTWSAAAYSNSGVGSYVILVKLTVTS